MNIESQLVKVESLSASAIDALDREVADFGERQSLLPLRPFVIRGELTYLNWEEYQGKAPKGAPPESEGLKLIIRITSVNEPAFRNGFGDEIPPVLKPGDEWPNIYFAKNPKLQFALGDHAKARARLFACIAPGQKPSAVLAKVRGQTLKLPIVMTRSFVRYSGGPKKAVITEDTFELVK